jgi:Protein of unknown function (DUF3108)
MAAWLKPLLLALLAALLLHLFGLIGIGSQMQSTGALAQKNDPLFTRTIEAASPQADPPPRAPPQPEPAPPRAPTAAVISQPNVTPTLPEPVIETVVAQPKPSEPEIKVLTQTVVTLTPTETIAEATPSQTLSTQPAGQTDSLLITGNWPADTRVSYKLTGYFQGELFGSGQVQWTRQGENNERYQVRVIVDAGLYELRWTSQGRVSPKGLLPEVFEEYTKRVLASARIRPLKLDENELILEGNRRVSRPAAEPLAVQDSVSQFIDIGHRFTEGRAKLQAGESVRIWLGRPGGLDEWTYDIGAEETITLPRIGPVTVHEFKPRPLANPRGTIIMSFWLAPSLQYLPAKIRIQLNPEAYAELIADQIQQR